VESNMSINMGGYDFDGPYNDPDEIKEELGVYVVLCLVDGMPHYVLDIGTAEESTAPTRRDPFARVVTRTGNLRHRLKSHDRKDCWRKNIHGTIGYAVRYIYNTNERFDVERELQWKLDYACGIAIGRILSWHGKNIRNSNVDSDQGARLT
jgi:hypothetical protein